jgi:hypothetical protein
LTATVEALEPRLVAFRGLEFSVLIFVLYCVIVSKIYDERINIQRIALVI